MTSEHVAIGQLKAGDIGGLAVLVEKYQVQAIRTAYLIVRDRSLAEDITQARQPIGRAPSRRAMSSTSVVASEATRIGMQVRLSVDGRGGPAAVTCRP